MDEPGEDSCYGILGVDPSASSSEIRQAYRKLALAKHPDRGGDPAEFARLSKAYEVLSDAKARAKYDETGRTSKLTAEEEFIEAFRGKREEPADREPAEASRRFAWERPERAEQRPGQRRSGGVHSFSANVGSRSPPAAEGYIRTDNLASAVREAGDGFSVGSRVRVVGLQQQPQLNNVLGVLVKFHGDRWQVRLEGGMGDKLLRAKNLEPTESFQIFGPGEGPERCLHPDRGDASPFEFHRLMGPDENRAGHSWTIGAHPEDDQAVAGARFEVILVYAANGRPDRLDWVRLNARPEAPPAPVARPKPYGGLTMSAFLMAAKSDWSQKDITSVCERLAKITVTDLGGLLRAVQSDGSANVNQRFKSVGEKVFTDQTMRLLRDHAKRVSDQEAKRLAPQPKPAAKGKAFSAKLPPLPSQEYQVVHDFAFVRLEPNLLGSICGKKLKGDTFRASEETWDGWVKLQGQPGYVIKDMAGKQNIGQVLAGIGRCLPLVMEEVQGSDAPLVFEVVYQPFVAVRIGPDKTRPLQGTRKFGDKVRAVGQAYGGWIRLCAEDGGGYMLTADQELGQLLKCRTLEERKGQVAALQSASRQRDPAALAEAVQGAKKCGVGGAELEAAEVQLRRLKQREALRKELVQRAAAAKEEGREDRLRKCLQEAEEEGLEQERQAMQQALDTLVASKAETQREHDVLLEQLAQAAASGDVAEIKAARNAAKAGGVPMKEIARIFALNQGGA
ncbi:unnamed protein product [Effrenium voratum]|nr:unnamed protein product [Effrenium voratum]